jgi:dimethylargininase
VGAERSRTMRPVFATFTHGFVREVSRSLAACELTHAPRQEFDLARARRQHEGYVAALRAASVTVTVLQELAEFPDAMFVEDVVLVLDEIAILTRPGARSRQPEVALIAPEIAAVRPVFDIRAPATLEGGDVLRLGRTLFVGRSSRTNAEGVARLTEIVTPFGYRVQAVEVRGCLHLKTAVTAPAADLLVANPRCVAVEAFADYEVVPIDPAEPSAANVLPVNGRVLVAASAPRIAAQLSARGLDMHTLDISELEKAEAGLTCSSVLFRQPAATTAVRAL